MFSGSAHYHVIIMTMTVLNNSKLMHFWELHVKNQFFNHCAIANPWIGKLWDGYLTNAIYQKSGAFITCKLTFPPSDCTFQSSYFFFSFLLSPVIPVRSIRADCDFHFGILIDKPLACSSTSAHNLTKVDEIKKILRKMASKSLRRGNWS